MNGWDLFTWFNAVVLLGATSLVFIFFLRDVGDFLRREGKKKE